jgi:hypothetical protein
MVNPGGLEPPAAGLKVPCPADPGFTLGVRSDPRLSGVMVCSNGSMRWCKPVESNHLPLGYRPRPSPFGLACGASNQRPVISDQRRTEPAAGHLITVYCLLFTVYCLLFTVYCLLFTVYCLLFTDY